MVQRGRGEVPADSRGEKKGKRNKRSRARRKGSGALYSPDSSYGRNCREKKGEGEPSYRGEKTASVHQSLRGRKEGGRRNRKETNRGRLLWLGGNLKREEACRAFSSQKKEGMFASREGKRGEKGGTLLC